MTKTPVQVADELNKRLDDLIKELDAVSADITHEEGVSNKEGDRNLATLEAIDLDAELAPVEKEAVGELENQFAEALKDLDDLGADLSRETAADEDDADSDEK